MKVYIRQPGGSGVPVTVRAEWLSTGKIIPRLYWTPDGSCHKIDRVYETVPMAFLKSRGEGLRFKIEATASDTDHIRREFYLYLADNLFCGKNIIDSRYEHESKEFIPVTLDIFPNCEYELIDFEARGVKYAVEKTIAVEPRGTIHAGGVGIWHKVEARRCDCENTRIAAVYFEINKWFVRVKAA